MNINHKISASKFLFFIMLTLITGCTFINVGKVAKGKEGIDTSELQPGIDKIKAETILGKPTNCWFSHNGIQYCI